MADLIVHKSGDDGGLVTKAFSQAAGGVVFTATFPDLEITRGADPALAGIETKHDFTERDLVEGTGFGWFDGEAHEWEWMMLSDGKQ